MTPSVAFQWFTPVFTIFGGIVIFIISQAVLKLMIEPVQQLKGAFGGITNTLLRHQALITNGRQDAEVSAKMFDHAAELVSKAQVVVCYRLAAAVFSLPTRVEVLKAAQELNSIGHQSMYKGIPDPATVVKTSDNASRKNHDSLKRIAELLKVKTAYQ